MEEITPNYSLYNFIVFDFVVSEEEGSSNDVLFYYCSSDNPEDSSQMRQVNEAGILTTFLYVPEQFGTSKNCDYIFSGKREFSLLPIGENLFFSASLLSTKPTHRLVLNTVLETVKNMLFMNLAKPKRVNGKFDPQWRNGLKGLMPHILNVIRWNDLVFTQLWNAYIPCLTIPDDRKLLFKEQLMKIQQKFDFITNAIITLQDKVVSSIHHDPIFTRILSLLINSKFKPYFPRKCKKRENVMQWIIGYVKEPDGSITCFTPPVYYEDRTYALSALQLNKVRLILVIDPRKIYDLNVLAEVTKDAFPILRTCDHSTSISATLKKSGSFQEKTGVKLCHHIEEAELELINHQIQPFHYNKIEIGVLHAHDFGNLTGSNSNGVFPVDKEGQFISYFERRKETDTIVVVENKSKGISGEIEQARKIAMA
ncbi:hypothetical protein GPJ56_010319 [Histomonas meleagridis]|uniref:uncharacterized protein n=1 Tax=Histomonas meleagridis TaxID=135588 RepID=UPI0035595CD4|nr:hypothetical protein GPJ56_010319 [Histomonas meleagridis]KAH0797926.1 hypothetical protein GO595_009555 [Histomonas meleagridis]